MVPALRIRAWHAVALLVLVSGLMAVTLGWAVTDAAKRPVNVGVPLSAPANEPIPAYDSFIGWGYVAGGLGQGISSFAAPAPKDAWQWYPRYGWYPRKRAAGARVYLYPYASGWMWTWTEPTGWLAMRTSDLQIGYRPVAIAT